MITTIEEDKLIDIKNVMSYINISKTRIYQLIRENQFPAPQKIGNKSLWSMNQIQKYINKVKEEQ
jgi:predicted DNA-binding transcriptional regulator AlpA